MIMLLLVIGSGLALLIAGDRYEVPVLVDIGAVLAIAGTLAIPVMYALGFAPS